MSITKSELVKYYNTKNVMVHFPNLEKKFFISHCGIFISLGMISMNCMFNNLWYCHFDPINIIPFVVTIILPN